MTHEAKDAANKLLNGLSGENARWTEETLVSQTHKHDTKTHIYRARAKSQNTIMSNAYNTESYT